MGGQDPAQDGYGSAEGYSSDGEDVGVGFGGGAGYDDLGGGVSDDDDDYGGGGGEAGVAPISLEDAFRDKPSTYEDLCRSHIVSYFFAFVAVIVGQCIRLSLL